MKSLKKLAAVVVIALLAVIAYYLYDILHEKTQIERLARVIHLEDRRDMNNELIDFLKDPDPVVRERSALAIGRIGANGAGELLYDLVTTDAIDVAATAAFAIGLTDEDKYADLLLDIGFDAPSKVGQMAVDAAGRLADSTMTETLDMLTTFLSHPSPEVRKTACLSLFRANAKNHAPALIDFIDKEPDQEVKISALYALSRMSIKEAYDVYVGFLSDSDPFARSLAVRGIGLSDSKEALNYLSIALNDGNKNVVAQAIASMAGKNDKKAKEKLLAKLEKEEDEKLIVDLINGLTRQGNENAIPVVKKLLELKPTDNIVEAGVQYLATVQKDRAVMMIDSLMSLNNTRIKAACADAYGIINKENIIPRLAVLFGDNNELVRATAFGYLIELDSTNVDFYIKKAMEDSSYMLRILALDQVKNRKQKSYLPQLLALSDRKSETAFEIRRSLVDCAGGFLEADKTDTIALKILINGILDRDYIIRKESAQVYKDILGEDRSRMVPPAKTHISVGKIEDALEKYERNPYAKIITNRGEIEMELYFDIAPLTVISFIQRCEDDFYEDITFHRVITNFVVQGGDPMGTGWGGAPFNNRCEYSPEEYQRGTLGIATSGKDTGSSQFFFTLSPQPHLNGRYTVFGQVLSGMDVVDDIVKGDTIKEIIIEESEVL